jgi:hypothetical protein
MEFSQILKRIMPMDSAVCFDLFIWKYGRGRDIQLERTSERPDLCEYYNHIGSRGSTYMDPEGVIYITIHDEGGATPATWYEEIMHAKQFLDRGQFSAGIGGTVAECEIEVASCLLSNANELFLTEEEIALAQRSLDHYSGGNNDV